MKRMLSKLFGKRYTKAAIAFHSQKLRLKAILNPYHYDADRYKETFLANKNNDYKITHGEKVNRVIYIFWTGDNEITPNRMKGIESLRKVSGVEVKLITNDILPQYIKEDDPLPEAYQYLSLNHKSDYLRSYFMHHYGGGYADIKLYFHSWVRAFDKLDNSEAYSIGYPEVNCLGAANVGISHLHLKNDLYNHWNILIGNGAFICRPYTKLTAEWHAEAKQRLIDNLDVLKQHPAKDFFGKNADYPLPWASMQGEIFHPLCLKYNKMLLKDSWLMPSFENYR